MKYNRLLPLLIPLLVLFFLELYYFFPKMIYFSSLLACLFLFFTISQFIKTGRSNEKWWNFFIFPVLFILSTTAFSVLMANKIVVQLLFLLTVIFLYLYLRILYVFLIKKDIAKKEDLKNIFSYTSFLIIFFLSSSIYGLQLFLNLTVWKLILVMMAAFLLVSYQTIWIYGINLKKGVFYIFLSCLILIEIAWTLVFLPLSFYIIGLVLAIYYYIVMGLIKFKLFNKLETKTVKMYIIFGFTGILLLLFTARWI